MYLSHFMYHGLVTTLHTLYSFAIYIYIYNVCFFTFILHIVFLFSLYTTCLCFTLDALMNLVLSVSNKTGCKSFMP